MMQVGLRQSPENSTDCKWSSENGKVAIHGIWCEPGTENCNPAEVRGIAPGTDIVHAKCGFFNLVGHKTTITVR